MPKSLLIFFVLIGILGSYASSVVAQDNDPGLLPHSPFYFLKGLSRTIQKIFTFTNAGKVEVALEIARIKMAELRKIQETIPDNIDAISRALEKYAGNASYLYSKLQKVAPQESGQRLSQIFNALTATIFNHQQIFDELRAKFEFLSDLKIDLDQVQDILSEILVEVPDLTSRVYFALDKDADSLKELRFAEVLDRLEEKIQQESKDSVIKLKEDLLLRFSGRLEAQALLPEAQAILPVLSEAPGDQLRRLEILDEIRESILNPDLKSQLNVVRQRILEKSQTSGSINSQRSERAIADSEAIAVEAENLAAVLPSVPKSVKQLLDRAEFNLGQARDLFKQGNYGGAYGQATAASAVYKNVISQLVASRGNYEKDVEDLKIRFDRFISEAKERGLQEQQYPKLFDFFEEGERRISELSKIVDSGKGSEKLIVSLRTAKLILATIEELLNNLK